jgi:hypothetical protein
MQVFPKAFVCCVVFIVPVSAAAIIGGEDIHDTGSRLSMQCLFSLARPPDPRPSDEEQQSKRTDRVTRVNQTDVRRAVRHSGGSFLRTLFSRRWLGLSCAARQKNAPPWECIVAPNGHADTKSKHEWHAARWLSFCQICPTQGERGRREACWQLEQAS